MYAFSLLISSLINSAEVLANVIVCVKLCLHFGIALISHCAISYITLQVKKKIYLYYMNYSSLYLCQLNTSINQKMLNDSASKVPNNGVVIEA